MVLAKTQKLTFVRMGENLAFWFCVIWTLNDSSNMYLKRIIIIIYKSRGSVSKCGCWTFFLWTAEKCAGRRAHAKTPCGSRRYNNKGYSLKTKRKDVINVLLIKQRKPSSCRVLELSSHSYHPQVGKPLSCAAFQRHIVKSRRRTRLHLQHCAKWVTFEDVPQLLNLPSMVEWLINHAGLNFT